MMDFILDPPSQRVGAPPTGNPTSAPDFHLDIHSVVVVHGII